ncbi:CASP-like protein 4A2 [Setaria italica]|uniref:CASP-like protein 4A2 n=1 Tax=Setaria italica TaxID=4555 RepID=UPI000350C2AA|nr:CASP-like protein 4A2 [Setaria italica]XP_034578669.1 CASP-like protein 4A2 [Setaria viridis]XP_034578670.1 CASP-like protein 4A2 [Setaria viridis]XP_034578671.1 CASP-like protein 4A2 [Setaria viridis]
MEKKRQTNLPLTNEATTTLKASTAGDPPPPATCCGSEIFSSLSSAPAPRSPPLSTTATAASSSPPPPPPSPSRTTSSPPAASPQPKASKLSARAFNELSSAHHHPRFDPDAVLVLLSSIGLSRANIADVVAVDPLLLRCKVDRLEPRLLALRDRVGLSVPQIASFLAVGSRAVRSCRDVGSKIQFFVNFYGSFEKLLLVIKKNSSLNHLTSDLGRVVKPNIALPRSAA